MLNATCKNTTFPTFPNKTGAGKPAIYWLYAIQRATEKISNNTLPSVKKLLPTLIILPFSSKKMSYLKIITESNITYHSFKRVAIIS